MKIITKALRTLLLLFGLTFLSGCGGDGMGGTGVEPGVTDSPAVLSTITRVNIPFREHGYSNFETLVFHDETEFNSFINEVNSQSSWNDKALFLQQIHSVTIDYSKQNFLLYRITESSGSNVLTPKSPALIDGKVTVVIDRQVPTVGTTDVAYYALAYKVDKNISEIVFDNGSSKISVDLTEPPITNIQGRLIRSNSDSLLAYFQESIKRNQSNSNVDQPQVEFSVAVADTSSGGLTGVSSTNIQEFGVDEADLIKTNGRYIFSVMKPAPFTDTPEISISLPTDTNSNTTPSDSIRIMDTQDSAGLTEIRSLSDSENPWSIAGIYLHETKKQLIALSSEKQNYYTNWFNSYYFSNQHTDVLFIDIDIPSTSSVKNKLSFDGQLIDSRRNGNTLYMVLRNYPDYQYADDQALATTTNDDFLPKYILDDSASQAITPPENCYIEEGQQGSADIITLIAIDLNATTPQINSQCYVGSAEAIYASQNALYLATTRWNYQALNGLAEYDDQITTDIHKFAYNGLNFDYRGSGEVDGHLGFRQGSKSFRFSEDGDLLRVVTFDEDQWGFLPLAVDAQIDETINQDATQEIKKSPVLLSILRDDPSSKSLKLVSKLPNTNQPDPIGLPGEQLYASRFIGDRAYLVTFRVTDPLYVLDLNNPENPKISGELKIDGYSEYLHPISENLLLGVGKDAIPSEFGVIGDGGRGAWYQGVKLSLVDVTDPSNPREADKVILGKRGTESTALTNHHGLTGLKVNNKYRVAIPVRLHADIPQSTTLPSSSTFYNYTHTGLYRFDIDINNQTIEQIPALIVNNPSNQNITNDRSLLINNDVFYQHNGVFWVQDWQGNSPSIGPK